jgi:hypothetical protein
MVPREHRVTRPRTDECAPISVAGTPPRIALYSHDTLGLGHVRRNLAIAEAVAASGVKPDILLISGASIARAFELPPRTDCLEHRRTGEPQQPDRREPPVQEERSRLGGRGKRRAGQQGGSARGAPTAAIARDRVTVRSAYPNEAAARRGWPSRARVPFAAHSEHRTPPEFEVCLRLYG